MAYHCPRCKAEGTDTEVQRNSNFRGGGLIGMLIVMAFSGFACPTHGPIPRSEFAPEDRGAMIRNSILMVVGAIVVFILLIVFLVAVNSF